MQSPFDTVDMGMSRGLASTSPELPSVRFVWSLRLVCSLALGISVYLAWTAFRMGNVFGCSGGELIDCGHVLTSHWSKIMGIPVSVPAAGLYASLIALLAFAHRSGPESLRQLVWGGMTLGSVMAGLAALWFIGLQVFVLKHYCPYCLVVHTCGIVLAVAMLASHLCPRSLKLKSAGISALGVVMLVVIQGATPKADQFETVHYDDVSSSPANAATVVEGNGSEVFESPGAVFEAPGEAFAPPVDVFEAPGFEDVASDPNTAETKSPATGKSGDSQDPKPQNEQPSVASTLLFILPPQFMRFGNLFLAVPDTDQDVSETRAAPETDDSTTPLAEQTLATEENPDVANKDDAKKSEAAAADSTEVPAAETPKVVERRLLTFAGNRFTLDIKQWPLLGKTDAKFVFVEMFDYTCPHCRNTHQAITGAQKRYGNDLAIFALPVPLESACNPAASGGSHPGACEMAKIAIAVWRLEPEKFQTFHDWMFQGHRTVPTARQFAETLVDKERLRIELSSDVPRQYISRHVSLYQRVGSGQVPKLIFPATTMQGEVNSSVTLCNAIERELAVVQK